MMRLISAALIVALLLPGVAAAQIGPPEGGPHFEPPITNHQPPAAGVWRDFAGQVAVGSELKVRLADGTRFRATLVRVDESGLLLQPKTRVPVPLQTVAYDAIAELEPTKKGGIGAGKAVAIGLGVGAGAFWGMVGIALMILSD
jgi:hypothetical protein